MKKGKVLVTGGFGYVGSRLTPHLVDSGYDVRVIDLALYGEDGYKALGNRAVEWIKGDIRDPRAVVDALSGVETVIHLAAISNDPTGDIDEALTRQVNFDAVGMLLGLAKKAGVKRFINASSSSVFGIKEDENVVESLEPEPLTFYSKYKMLSEWLVVAAASDEFTTVNIRPATVCGYSPRQRFDLTVNKLTIDALTKGVISVHGGQQRRPNIGMDDMINIYCRLICVDKEKINGRTFNFGFENLKVIEIAEKIKEQLSDIDIKIEITESRDNRDYHISSHKIIKELGYEPVSSIAQQVSAIRKAYEGGNYSDPSSEKYYNMKSMSLNRQPTAYEYLAR